MKNRIRNHVGQRELAELFGERFEPAAFKQWKEEKEVHEQRAEQLAKQLMSSEWLPFIGLAPRRATLGEIAERFGESFERLRRCFGETDKFAQLICRVNIKASSDRPRLEAKVSEQKLAEIARELRQRLPKRSPLRLDLIEEVFEEARAKGKGEQVAKQQLYERLMEELREMARDTARYLFQTVDNLVEKELVGLIRWRGDGLCTFSFFTNEVTASVKSVERDDDREITYGRTVHRHVRHDHELVEAKEHGVPGPQTLIVPVQQAELMRGIPAWIKPLCKVVDGTQVLERQIAVDVDSENWREVRRFQPEVKQVVQHDPAITLGNLYVLSGWGKAEIDEEERRRSAVKLASRSRFLEERARKVKTVLGSIKKYLDPEIALPTLFFLTFFVLGVFFYLELIARIGRAIGSS